MLTEQMHCAELADISHRQNSACSLYEVILFSTVLILDLQIPNSYNYTRNKPVAKVIFKDKEGL